VFRTTTFRGQTGGTTPPWVDSPPFRTGYLIFDDGGGLIQDHRMAERHAWCLTSAAWRDGADARRRVLVTPRLICTNSRLPGDPQNGQLDSLPPPERLGLGRLPRVVRLPGPNP
jgi:hypothetical protein